MVFPCQKNSVGQSRKVEMNLLTQKWKGFVDSGKYVGQPPLVWLYKVIFLKTVLFQYQNSEMNLHQLVKKYCQKVYCKRSKQDHKNV